MNSLLDDLDDDRDRTDRELTLSTGTILSIFFGLVLLCGLFFGFGYKLGSHKASPQVEAATAVSSTDPTSTFSDFKPAAGSSDGGSAALPPSGATVSDSAENGNRPEANTPATNSSDTSGSGDTEDPVRPETAPVRQSTRASGHAASPAAVAAPEAASAGTIFVQVAAVSHEEDAKLLVNALRAKGYPVSAHTQPQDKFFHIQVGPFDSLKDAQTTRQRLLADGYQPIIK